MVDFKNGLTLHATLVQEVAQLEVRIARGQILSEALEERHYCSLIF